MTDTKPTPFEAARDALLAVLGKHVQSVRNDRCECGWVPDYSQPLRGDQHRLHVADMIVQATRYEQSARDAAVDRIAAQVYAEVNRNAGRKVLAQVIRKAFEAQSGSLPDEGPAITLEGTYDLLAVADAVAAAVHAEQEQTVRRVFAQRRVFAERLTMGDIAARFMHEPAERSMYRRQILGEWLENEPTNPDPWSREGRNS